MATDIFLYVVSYLYPLADIEPYHDRIYADNFFLRRLTCIY
jgi:hypothetical protein